MDGKPTVATLQQGVIDLQPAARQPVGVKPTEDFGDPLGPKPAGCARLAYGNINGLSPYDRSNEKAMELKHYLRTIEADLFGGCEANLNWKRVPPENRLNELFRTENALKTKEAFNTHEDSGRYQQGGTFMLAFGEMATRVVETGVDSSGLGRWTWMRFIGRNGHKARIITAYVPCRSTIERHATVWAQQTSYLRTQGEKRCPRVVLLEDLAKAMIEWRSRGEKLILLVDANEDTSCGKLWQRLRQPDLDMHEGIQTKHPNLPKTPTFRDGWVPIDGIFVTKDLPLETGTWLAVGKAPGDHRHAVVDIKWNILLGECVHKIVRPNARRLSTRILKARKKYVIRLEEHSRGHKLLQRLHHVYQHNSRHILTTAQETTLVRVDKTKHEGMTFAERRCRKYNMGQVDSSPQVLEALDRVEVRREVYN